MAADMDPPGTPRTNSDEFLSRMDERLTRIENALSVRTNDAYPKSAILRRMARFDQFWLTRFMFGLGAWLFVVTIAGFVLEYRSYNEDRATRRAEDDARRLAAISQAWETLLRPVGGNTGKGAALTLLLQQGQSIAGADLSCEGVGTWRDGTCLNPAIFSDLDLVGRARADGAPPDDEFMKVTSARFAGNTIAGLRSAYLPLGKSFKDVRAFGWKIDRIYSASALTLEPGETLGTFSCMSCYLGGGDLHWNDFRTISRSVVNDVWVWVPDSAMMDQSTTESRIITTLDRPLRFVRADPIPLKPELYIPNFQNAEQFKSKILWDFYEDVEFCANAQDSETLKLPERRRFPSGDYVDRSVSFSIIDPEGAGEYRCRLTVDQVMPLLAERLVAHDRYTN